MQKFKVFSNHMLGSLLALFLIGCGSDNPEITPPAVDNTPLPKLISVIPADQSTDVPTNTTIMAAFSQSVEPAALNPNSFSLADAGGSVVPGTISYDAPNMTALLTPTEPLADDTDYTVNLASVITGKTNEALNLSVSSHFRTGKGKDLVPPSFTGLASVVADSSTSISLSWTAATDNRTAQAQIIYHIYQSMAPGGENFTSPTYTTLPGATSYQVAGLNPVIPYYFVTRAKDMVGNIDSNTIERAMSLQTVSSTSSRPRGIYVLDTPYNSTMGGPLGDVNMRDGNISVLENHPSLTDGYLLRLNWKAVEPQQGVYDFTVLDFNINKLSSIGKKMTLLLDGSGAAEPDWLIATSGVLTFSYPDCGPDHVCGGSNSADDFTATRVRPWDTYTQTRFLALAQALANHTVGGYALKNHPTLSQINMGIPGLSHIRDKFFTVKDITGFNRSVFKDAVIQSLHSVVDNFTSKYAYIGLWKLKNDTGTPELAEYLRAAILTEFDGVKNPRVGFFQEDLSASKDPVTGVVSASPNPDGNAFALYLSKDVTYSMLQATQQWTPPLDAATPGDAIQYAYDTFGTTYFEIYAVDIDNPNYGTVLQQWHDFLLTQ